MANMKPARSRSGSDEDDAFGWQLYHDRQRNLVYYLHSYTGEVRWPRPETVGFVMHGLKPLPAHAAAGAGMDPSVVNPDIWSPYYPHVVMLPSGLMQVHPGPGSESQGATEMWCGYNRFPLANFGAVTGSGGFAEQHGAAGLSNPTMMPSGPRTLPPTWEESRSGSPFLPPYPVTILGRDSAEDKQQSVLRSPLRRLDEHFHTPEIDAPRSYQRLQSGEMGRVQASMDWSMLIHRNTSTGTPAPAPDRKQPAYPKGYPAPNPEKKEHNRKGYLLRQARKMMRDSGSTATTTASAPSTAVAKQRRTQEVPSAAKSGPKTLIQAEKKQDIFTPYGDYEAISPLHC
ncbi:WW domain [Phytophthora cinnamomi]|uniref:WW domain n=1 Tax=Phytophthora cinnamomi TaxID=4785 RepID=UPI003559AA84|nr:WW domain [Phytophthora cinnamomi]